MLQIAIYVLLQGRLTLLLGPPGAGKTTMLKAISGKLRRDDSLKVPVHMPFSDWEADHGSQQKGQIDLNGHAFTFTSLTGSG